MEEENQNRIIKCRQYNCIPTVTIHGYNPLSLKVVCRSCALTEIIQFKDFIKNKAITLDSVSNNFEKEINIINQAEEYLSDYYSELKNQQGELDEQSKAKLNAAYEEGIQSNKEIITFLKALLLDYTEDNTDTHLNVKNNFSKITLIKIKENPSLDEVISFFEENHIISKGKSQQSTEVKYKGIKTIASVDAHYQSITSLCLLKDGRLASGSKDKTIKVFRISNEFICDMTFIAHKKSVTSLCILNDGRLVSTSEDGSIRIWVIGSESFYLCSVLSENDSFITIGITISDDLIASYSYDSKMKVWSVSKGSCEWSIYIDDYNICGLYKPKINDNVIVSLGYQTGASFWDMGTRKLIKEVKVKCSDFNMHSEFGKEKLIIFGNGNFYIVDCLSMQIVSSIQISEEYMIKYIFSPNGEYSILADINGKILILNGDTFSIEELKAVHEYRVNKIISIKDGVFCSCSEKSIVKWELI